MSIDAIFAYFFLNYCLIKKIDKPNRNQLIIACKQGLTFIDMYKLYGRTPTNFQVYFGYNSS